ncbi:MAG: LytTR family DNA-binding domain-containing protein [Oscillospiraceae bacterium]|nr:LytTR family DNA-binding domain-containing protein [Oscillospiraceae bacterium]
MEIRMAICDDEQQQAEYIRAIINKWAEQNRIQIRTDMFSSAEDFKSTWNESEKYDILLLDIQMGGQNGVELAKEIRKSDTKTSIVFITGFADYMAEGYDVSALHYLMKPVKEDKLFEVFDKAVKNLEKDTEFLSFTINRKDIFIPLRDIIYIESSLHYVIINTEREQYKIKMPLAEIETKLGGGFYKCTRSFIVGLRYIRRISKDEIILTDGVSVPLGRGLYKDINKAFIKYF